jgi:hypothetical protein
MNAFGELWRAIIGWLDLLTARPGAAAKFNLTGLGLINATGCFFGIVLLLIVIESALSGFPGWATVMLSVLANALQLAAVWAVIAVTARLFRTPAVAMAVPATYAVAFVLGLTLPLAYLGGSNALTATLGVIGFMLFRVAREVGKLRVGISAAFAILSIVALVATRVGLYMLTTGLNGVG